MALIVCLLLVPLTAFGEESAPGERAYALAGSILDNQISRAGKTDYESWLREGLFTQAGSEWYLLNLIQLEKPMDVEAAVAYLDDALAGARVLSASEQLKYALVYCALGQRDNAHVLKALEESVGAQGVMSCIYGLHLLNNGLESPRFTREELINVLLDQRKSDGGWAVMGLYGDTDVTAMALQALAPYSEKDENVKAAVDGALAFLSAKQVDNGAFMGFGGGENPESTAQVVIALCALGIDPLQDARFIKNGFSALDGLQSFALEEGGYCHQIGAPYNATATMQSFMTAVSLWRLYEGKGSVYLFDGVRETLEKNEQSPKEKKASPVSYKTVALLIISDVLLICFVVLFLRGKRNYKSYLFAFLLCGALALVIALTNFQSTKEYYNADELQKPNAVGSVRMTIRCDTIRSHAAENEFIPADGVILPMTEFKIDAGETAYDILTQAARRYNIRLDSTGSAFAMLYVKGIQYIYEYEHGEQSGWMYYVNGIAPSVNAAEYVLSDGDVIQWMYSLDIGQDLQDYIIKPDSAP